MSSELPKLAASFPIVVLTGPRAVGKTALLEHVFAGYRYLSLDDSQAAEAAESRPQELLSSYPPPLLVDEVQYAPALFRHLKVFVDKHRGECGLFVVTGSQSFPLMRAVSESLAGRAAVVPFLGLSAEEWQGSALGAEGDRQDFLWRGTYPGLWGPQPQPDRDRWYQGYLATYLERDVRALLNVSRLRDFERFLRACAIRNAQPLNMSELARDVGISPSTAREWLGVLHASAQVYLLEPYHRNLGKRLTKTPKLYFTDTGLAAFLCGFQTAAALSASAAAGAFWESHVLSQWIRWRDWRVPSASLWYWQDQSKNEVDLVVEKDGLLYPIECKRTERPRDGDLRGMRAFHRLYGNAAVGASYVACLCRQVFEVAPRVSAVNGWVTWKLGS